MGTSWSPAANWAAEMAAPQPCADGSCCSHPGAVPGVQQTLEEMDFERGEKGEAAVWLEAGSSQSQPPEREPKEAANRVWSFRAWCRKAGRRAWQEALRPHRFECGRVN